MWVRMSPADRTYLLERRTTEMTFSDLHRTCREALESGKIGSPVALCLHVQLADVGADLQTCVGALIEFAAKLFESDAARLMARGDLRQCSLLVSFGGGETLQVNAGCGSASATRLQMLLIGNGGTLQLEGGECFDESELPADWSVKDWNQPIRESLQSHDAVQL